MTSLTARSVAEQAETTIKTVDTIVAGLVERVEAEGMGPEASVRFYRLMTSLASALPALHEMGIVDANGNVVVKTLIPDQAAMQTPTRRTSASMHHMPIRLPSSAIGSEHV